MRKRSSRISKILLTEFNLIYIIYIIVPCCVVVIADVAQLVEQLICNQ